VQYISGLRKAQEAVHKSCTELVIYSEGSIGWSDVWTMTFDDRNQAVKVLNEFYSAKSGKSSKELL
jgi:hypothetical protein